MNRAEVILSLVNDNLETVGAEIGVLKGITSAAVLEGNSKTRLYLVDRWTAYPANEIVHEEKNNMPKQSQKYFDDAEKQARAAVKKYRGRYKILKMESLDAAKEINEKLDFVFIDARHDYEGCLADIKAWKTKVKKGGLVMGHDYGNFNHPGVTKAVDEQFKKIELFDDNVWVYRK